MRFHASGIAALSVILTLSGCAELPPGAILVHGSSAAPEARQAGTNLVGESCRYEQQAGTPAGGFAGAYFVYCGTWQQPSGRVFRATQPAPAAELARLAEASAWRTLIDERFSCGTPEPTAGFGDAPAQLLRCTRRYGGWPHFGAIADIGGATYLIDGVPSALPALQATIAAIAGGKAAPAAAGSLIATIAAHPFGSGDLDAFYTFMRLGSLANDGGDYSGAEQAYRNALAIQERVLGVGDPGLALAVMELALQISDGGRFVEADRLFVRARSLVAQQGPGLTSARYHLYLAEHEANRSRLGEASADAAVAEREFGEAAPRSLVEVLRGAAEPREMTIADAVLLGPDEQTALSGLASSWSLRSTLAYMSGDYGEAKRRAEAVRALLRTSGVNPPGILPRVARLAGVSTAREGASGSALQDLGIATVLFGTSEARERPVAITTFLAGRTARAGGDEGHALELFRQGAKVAREQHLGLPASLVGEYLEALDRAAHEPGADRQALSGELFYASQLIQGSVTAQVVVQALARLAASDPKVRDALRDLQNADLKLQQLYARRDRAALVEPEQASAAELKSIDAEIVATQETRAAADAAAQAASPEYSKIISTDAPVDAVQKILRPREGLLSIVIGNKTSFAALIAPGDARAYRIDMNSAQAAQAVTELRKSIELGSKDGRPALPVFDVAAAHRLYVTLLAPVADKLKDLDRLVVVPTGPLSSLPLEVLVTEETAPVAGGNYKDVPFLVTRLAISYVPSPQTLLVLRANAGTAPGSEPYIGFGDLHPASARQIAAVFPPDRCAADYEGLSRLPPLPGTRREIEAVARLVFHAPPEDIVLGDNFTKARLTKTDLTRFRIIHLATHGFLPTELHCRAEPLIAVSPPPGAATAADAFLGLTDILALKMDADLVLLSACNSAGPEGAGSGDSLSGLAKAFFFAGARGLLVTHWALDDNAAPLLTSLALTPAGGSADSAEDLRQAKLTMIRKIGARPGAGSTFFTHPYAWAPFVLIGDGIRASAPSG